MRKTKDQSKSRVCVHASRHCVCEVRQVYVNPIKKKRVVSYPPKHGKD